mgnify:CR=1 FL=1
MKKQLLAALLFGGVTGMLFGLEPLLFDRTQWKPVNLKHPGSETVELGTAPLGDTGRTVPVLAWGTPRPPVVELALQGRTPKLEKFERAEFILTLNAPEALPLRRIVLRLADRSGETFQFAPDKAGGLVQGRNVLRYTGDAAAPKGSIWGGDGNKKIDWPLRVAGIAIDMNRETPGDRRILLDSLECRPSGEHAAIALRTGHRLNLLLPERKTPPELVIRNTGLEPLELTGTLTISDAGDGIRTEPVSCGIAPGGEAMLPLPGVSKPSSSRSKVDLPEPDSPTTATNSPGCTGFERPERICRWSGAGVSVRPLRPSRTVLAGGSRAGGVGGRAVRRENPADGFRVGPDSAAARPVELFRLRPAGGCVRPQRRGAAMPARLQRAVGGAGQL